MAHLFFYCIKIASQAGNDGQYYVRIKNCLHGRGHCSALMAIYGDSIVVLLKRLENCLLKIVY